MTDNAEAPAVDPYAPFSPFASWRGGATDVSLLDAFSTSLNASRDAAGDDTWVRMLDMANKWAAVDTGAIESLYEVDRGFTYSVAATTSAWARIPQQKGEDVARVMADQLAGYEHVLDAATKNVEVSEYWIKGLHSVLCASQETYKVWTDVGWQERQLPKGQYKSYANNPLNLKSNRVHSYAPPMDVVAEMGRLIAELRSPGFLEAPAVVQAAYAHYAFVCVHPFADGNGRVSRALASVYLYRSVGLPLVIFADEKARYLDGLEAADEGDATEFVLFVRDCVIDSVNLVKVQIDSETQLSLDAQMETYSAMLLGRGGLTHMQVDESANRLVSLITESIQEQVMNAALPEQLSLRRDLTYPNFESGAYRRLGGNVPTMTLDSASPATASASRWYAVCVAKPTTEGADFVVVKDDMEQVLAVFIREVYPVVTEALRLRVQTVVGAGLRHLMTNVQVQALESLRNAGYA